MVYFQFDEDEFSRLGDDSFGMAVDAKTSTSTGENDEFQDFHTFQVKASIDTETTTSQSSLYKGDMSIMAEDSGGVSRVSNESPMDALSTAKTFTPSLASSGYGSQAISTQTLSSEDSNSVQSINVDDMNDLENKLLGGSHHIKKSNTNEGLAEDMNAACESSVKLNRSDSLIDADVPADLRSPMKPTTPYSEQRPKLDVSEAEGDLEAMEGAGDGYQTRFVPSDIRVEEDGGDSAEMIKSADEVKVTKDVVSEDVGFRIQDVEDSVVCRETSASEDAVSKLVGNVSLDFYSESAMSELEGISESHDENATFSSSADVSFSTPVKNQGTSGANHSQTTVVLENSNTENCCTKKDDIVITKAIERHHAGVTPTIDVGKSSVTSGSKPRLRGGDKVSGRSAPLKATYRPASMNLEVSGGAGEERGSSCEDLNSGLYFNGTSFLLVQLLRFRHQNCFINCLLRALGYVPSKLCARTGREKSAHKKTWSAHKFVLRKFFFTHISKTSFQIQMHSGKMLHKRNFMHTQYLKNYRKHWL